MMFDIVRVVQSLHFIYQIFLFDYFDLLFRKGMKTFFTAIGPVISISNIFFRKGENSESLVF